MMGTRQRDYLTVSYNYAVQWNLFNLTATCGPVIIGLYREVAALQR